MRLEKIIKDRIKHIRYNIGVFFYVLSCKIKYDPFREIAQESEEMKLRLYKYMIQEKDVLHIKNNHTEEIQKEYSDYRNHGKKYLKTVVFRTPERNILQSLFYNGKYYACAVLSYEEERKSWKDIEKESLYQAIKRLDNDERYFCYHFDIKSQASKERPFLIMLHGCDDTVYSLTFEKEEEALSVMSVIETYSEIMDDYALVKAFDFVCLN